MIESNIGAADKPLRVLQVAKWCSPYVGGIERVVEDIAAGVNGRAEMELLVCADGKDTVYETRANGVKVVRAGKLCKISSMPISFKFLRLFRKMSKNADVIQFHAPFPWADLALFLCHRKNAVKTVWWHSDVVRQKKLMFFYKPLMKWFLKRIDCIYVAGNGIRDHSKYLGKYRDKVKVIHFGLDEKEYLESPAIPVLTERLTDKSNKKILFTGRLVYYKGVEVLLDAFDGIEGAELFIVGEGELHSHIEKKAKTLKNAGKVHILGALDDVRLKAAYRDCDIFVLPSVQPSECFGIVQLEAMIYGKPVINTSLPTSVPEVSLDGESGITVEPGNAEQLRAAIDKLCRDDELRERYGREAQKRMREQFNLQIMADKIFRSYVKKYEEKKGTTVTNDRQ